MSGNDTVDDGPDDYDEETPEPDRNLFDDEETEGDRDLRGDEETPDTQGEDLIDAELGANGNGDLSSTGEEQTPQADIALGDDEEDLLDDDTSDDDDDEEEEEEEELLDDDMRIDDED